MIFIPSRIGLALLTTTAVVQAFAPTFSSPRQCSEFKVSWSVSPFAELVSTIETAISITFAPLDINHAKLAPEPFTISVPCHPIDGGEFTVPALPFPEGTQFIASAHIPGAVGPTRRRLSSILTVLSSSDASCLTQEVPIGRPRAKSFGRSKRQVTEIGIGIIDANAPTPPINVIGHDTIPVSGEVDTPGNAISDPNVPTPPVSEIGHATIPADASVVDGGSSTADTTAAEGTETTASDEATTTSEEMVTTESTNSEEATTTSEMMDTETSDSASEPCTTSESNAYDQPTETVSGTYSETVTYAPIETSTSMADEMSTETSSADQQETTTMEYDGGNSDTGNTEVVHYSSLEDMVNHANSMYKAWNPHQTYTPGSY